MRYNPGGKLSVLDAFRAVKREMVRIEERRRRELGSPSEPTPEATEADAARASLREFVRQAWPYVEPGFELRWGWHLDEICGVLEKVSRGEEKRVIILVPPGNMKSLLTSVLHPSWEWTRDAGLRYLTFSYASEFAMRDALKMRALVSSPWYRSRFGVGLKPEQYAKRRFETTAGGWRVSSSVGGIGTGEHPDRIIIDDPMKAGETLSQPALDEVKFWFNRVVSTRLARDPSILVIMQRLHQDDLAGHLIELGGWRVVTFPMRFDPKRADPLDHRKVAGELLWPDGLWDEARVREEELHLGPFGAAGQLQQEPVPEGGGLYKRDWFTLVDVVPAVARRCRGWDTAATEGGGDWTVGVKLAYYQGITYVEDVIRVQQGPGSVDNLMAQTARVDGKACMQREEREGGAAGKAVIAARAKRMLGYDYAEASVSGNKVTRGKPFRAQCEAGNVRMKRAPWNEAYLQEMAAFPVGKHDDQHDGTSCAFNALIMEVERNARLTW